MAGKRSRARPTTSQSSPDLNAQMAQQPTHSRSAAEMHQLAKDSSRTHQEPRKRAHKNAAPKPDPVRNYPRNPILTSTLAHTQHPTPLFIVPLTRMHASLVKVYVILHSI